MFLTAFLCAKVKSKFVLVLCESMVSGHKVNLIRERLADKMEFMQFDPYAQVNAFYRERKKLRSIKDWKGENTYKNGYNSRMVGEEFKRMHIINLADKAIETLLAHGDDDALDYGFGKSYKWWSLPRGFDEAKRTGKPIFLVIHKTTCPACIKLKEKFSRSVKLIDMSQYFVMINIENSSDLIKSEIFTPDGKYVPRILFFTSTGEFIRNAYNRHADADPEHRYFYSRPVQIIQVMQQVIDNSGRNPLPEPGKI